MGGIDIILHFKAFVVHAFINTDSVETHKREKPSGTEPPLKRRAASKAPPELRFGPGNHKPQFIEAKNENRCHGAVTWKNQVHLHLT